MTKQKSFIILGTDLETPAEGHTKFLGGQRRAMKPTDGQVSSTGFATLSISIVAAVRQPRSRYCGVFALSFAYVNEPIKHQCFANVNEPIKHQCFTNVNDPIKQQSFANVNEPIKHQCFANVKTHL